ncbi:MAG: VgrG-related protein [Dehalococcoidia bacterium]|nr:VgrG-related protein [Dehalococcoidia bacterium]
MPEQAGLISQFYIKLDGADAPQGIMDNLILAEVDDALNIPDMFAVQIRDPKLEWTDSDTMAIGKEIEISVRGESGQVKLITGEVTSCETSFKHGAGATMAVRGYDQSHRLNRGRQTRSFVQVTDSDIATRIARDLGLKVEAESTSEVHEYVLQDNQTNLEFLEGRARRIGFRLFVEGGTLYFQRIPEDSAQAPTLEWGVNLLEFNARLTTSQQTSEVEVRGWDPQAKREIVGRVSRAQDVPEIGERRQGGQVAEAAFGSAGKEIVVNRVVSTQAEADSLAQSLCEEMGGDFILADGVCSGNPAVRAGVMAEFKGLSDRFQGRYRITHAVHRYDAKGYTTRFHITGRHANTLGELISPRSGGSGSHSVVVGIVTNNQDPDEMGRLKVKFPWLAEGTESHWARIATPMAGQDRGMVFLPEVNDEVLLAFEHGDLNRPYILGGLWGGVDKPPEGNKDGKNNIRKIRSRSGHEIIFDDNDEAKKEKIEIHTKAGHKILLDDSSGQEKIEISDKTGNNVIKMDSAQNSITVSSANKLGIDAQMIEINATGTLTLKAGADVTIQGAMVRIN